MTPIKTILALLLSGAALATTAAPPFPTTTMWFDAANPPAHVLAVLSGTPTANSTLSATSMVPLTPPRPTQTFGVSNLTLFSARPGFGASWVSFFVANNAVGSNNGSELSTACETVLLPAYAGQTNRVGGWKPSLEGVKGGCTAPDVTWEWLGDAMSYGKGWYPGDVDQNGNPYYCYIGYVTQNAPLVNTNVVCGNASLTNFVPVQSGWAIC